MRSWSRAWPSTRPAERPVFSNDPLDTGIRPESNACSEGPGKVGDGEVDVDRGNPGLGDIPLEGMMVYQETVVRRDQHRIHVRDHPGAGPPIILMQEFPDNLHLYDCLVPYLSTTPSRSI